MTIKNVEYNPETGIFTRPSGKIVGTPDQKGYLRGSINGKVFKLHRLAFLMMGKGIPEEVDHINRDKSDNRWCNLRAVTSTENQQNRRSKNVYHDKKIEFL